MTIPFPSAGPASHHREDELRWSKSERAIARRAFDHALNQELQEVIPRAKQMADEAKEPYELWELEQHLTQFRKEIDRKYDYRYSQLTVVFGKLLHEGRLGEQELRG
jgi:Photoprotection regulator fluorescence recovery protein